MRKKTIVTALCLIIVPVAVATWWWNWDYERRWGCFDNREGFCYNCSSFVRNFMEMHTERDDGWYPRGGKTPLDSIARSPEFWGDTLAGNFGCHIWNPYGEWKETGTITEKYCTYRYNEGLQVDDPKDLIVLYWYKPTVWIAHDQKGDIPGRQVLFANGFMWQFMPEEEFQNRQRRTEVFLQERQRRAGETALVRSNLIVSVLHTNTGPGSHRFSADIRNAGTNTANVVLLETGRLVHWEGRSYATGFLEKKDMEIHLEPGEVHAFLGWFELTVVDQLRDGKVISRSTQRKSSSGLTDRNGDPVLNTGQGWTWFGDGRDLSVVNADCRVQASFKVRTDIGRITNLQLVLKSPEYRYMDPHKNSVKSIGATPPNPHAERCADEDTR